MQTFTVKDDDKEIKGTSGILATDLAENDLQDVGLQENNDEDIESLWKFSCNPPNEPSFFVPS